MLPELFLNRMKLLLKEDFKLFLKSYEQEQTRAIHLNQMKWNSSLEQSLFTTPIPELKNGYMVNEKVGNHPYHHAGLIYSQEPSAMIPAQVAPIKDHFHILDLCAAPGGKTFQLAEQVPNGMVIANEMNFGRAKKLLSNVERLGLKNVVVTSMRSDELKNVYQGYFDLILVDAPCSGEGMFRKDHEAVKEWSIEKVEELSNIQKKLLEDASSMLKQNGYLIYSTCTFSLTENEEVVSSFLDQHQYVICDVQESLLKLTKEGIALHKTYDFSKMRRCYPYLFGEGQFVALLQKLEKCSSNHPKNQLETPTKEQEDLISLVKQEIKETLIFRNYRGTLVIVPNLDVVVPNLRTLACFVTVGTLEHGVFVPHHQFVKTYGTLFQNQYFLKLGDPRVLLYLKGFELEGELQKGYGVLLVDNLPLGLIKSSQGKLKNHYPKGLRIQ